MRNICATPRALHGAHVQPKKVGHLHRQVVGKRKIEVVGVHVALVRKFVDRYERLARSGNNQRLLFVSHACGVCRACQRAYRGNGKEQGNDVSTETSQSRVWICASKGHGEGFATGTCLGRGADQIAVRKIAM